MFNGNIFNKGSISKILKRPKGINIFIKSDLKLSMKDIGVSVACDGVCLTLISIKKRIMEFYLSNETIRRSKFKYIKLNDRINLELPLKYGQKISGHICQGHVDAIDGQLHPPLQDLFSTRCLRSIPLWWRDLSLHLPQPRPPSHQ